MNKSFFGLLVVLTTGLMGSSFAIGKMGLLYMSPLLLVGVRFTLAGIIMALVVIALKRKHPVKLVEWLQFAVIGFFQTAGVMGAVFLSMRTITAGEASILVFTSPMLVVIVGTVFLKAKYRLAQWIGVGIGFLGVFITLGASLDLMEAGTLLGFYAAISWTVATFLLKKWGPSFDTWVMTAYQMLFGGLLILVCSVFIESIKFIATPSSIFIILWLAIMASIVQFAIWFYLLEREEPGKVSAFLFLVPLFGVLSGWALLQEQPHISSLIGGSLILVGIFLVNKPKKLKEIHESA